MAAHGRAYTGLELVRVLWPRYQPGERQAKQNFVAPPTVRHGERSEAIQPRRDA